MVSADFSLSPTAGLVTRERGNAFIRSAQIRSRTALLRLTPYTVRVTGSCTELFALIVGRSHTYLDQRGEFIAHPVGYLGQQ
jgi:hypothetical protein